MRVKEDALGVGKRGRNEGKVKEEEERGNTRD